MDYLRHGSRAERQTLQHQLGKTEEEMQQLLSPQGTPAAPELVSQLGYVPAWMEARYWTLSEFGNLFAESRRDFALGDRLLRSLRRQGPLPGRCVLQRSLYIHSKTSLSGVTLQALGDRVEMAHAVEGRLPFLDRRVVDLARRLPCSLKIRHGAEKYILRKAMRTVIPAEVCGRRKRALAAPPALTQRSSAFGHLLQDTLRSASSASLPFLNQSAMKTLLDRLPSLPLGERQAWDGPLLGLASACILFDRLIAA
jgi:asparagine synthase (glutamine-hydrolysing)